MLLKKHYFDFFFDDCFWMSWFDIFLIKINAIKDNTFLIK
ncbi:hypothetical protein PROVALCAL_01023 [Providencia alcalifaciens DSM 30120]|uniref:Uncharacterized protein n=1 Tax=Providencia alcalifaciens DSM 30120 TaxID=520999 RepID=B6XCF9_9GAMM|nr:hypothetical protein PROVALCAL_01023 [Providencia alcalifaciens DSM 30120]